MTCGNRAHCGVGGVALFEGGWKSDVAVVDRALNFAIGNFLLSAGIRGFLRLFVSFFFGGDDGFDNLIQNQDFGRRKIGIWV